MENINELYHHGIKGQRWGIRRFQNKDGSLTPAGEKRRAKLEGKLEKLGGKKKTAGDDTAAQTPKKKRASEMSDDELDKAIVRARKEDEYNRLRPEPVVQSKRNVLVEDMLKPALMTAGRNAMQNAISKMSDKLISKAFGDKVDPDSIEALTKTFNKLDLKNKIDKLQNPDKHLSEEDKNKRQQREFEAENREAQREGYQSVQDRAAKQKAAAEQASKDAKAADEAARSANEAKSREYYERENSTYSKSGGERTTINPNEVTSLAVYNQPISSVPKTTTSNGKSYVDNYYYEVVDIDGSVIWGGNRGDDD